jgi:hypothetical protein
MLHRSFVLRTPLVMGCVAVVCFAANAEGQSVAPLRLGAGVGTSINTKTGAPHGGHAVLSVTSQAPGSRLGFRVEALFDGSQEGVHREGEPFTWVTNRTVALTINPFFRVWGRRTGLYVIAGVGIYQNWYESQVLGSTQTRISHFDMGANLGVGFDFKAFDREMFFESRLHTQGFNDRAAMTLGVRF